MSRINNRVLAAIGAVAIAAAASGSVACGSGSEPPPAATSGASSDVAGELQIALTTEPDPVVMGPNMLEARVTRGGAPVTDATVTVEFFMPAMPEMKMAEMRTKADLTHQGSGVYRGSGQVMMAGDWDVTTVVMRAGQELGRSVKKITAK